jgi:hypothetical protein
MDDRYRENLGNREGGAHSVLGVATGGGMGCVLGAVMGAGLAGPVGMLVGVTVGTVLGAIAGYGVDYDYESHEPEFRRRHESMHPQGGHTFEEASPAYRYGWESHDKPEFQDHSYDNVRPALYRGWSRSSDFADYEDYIKDGWERRAASKAAG